MTDFEKSLNERANVLYEKEKTYGVQLGQNGTLNHIRSPRRIKTPGAKLIFTPEVIFAFFFLDSFLSPELSLNMRKVPGRTCSLTLNLKSRDLCKTFQAFLYKKTRLVTFCATILTYRDELFRSV